ncbi:MAG: hypothetical protein ACRD0F_05225 [Acidimicrobiales bacterium]
MTIARAPVVGGLAITALVAGAAPAAAHGLGGRSDLPLPVWMFAYGAAAVLVLTFAALAALWRRSRLEGGVKGSALLAVASGPGRVLAGLGRAVGLAAFGVVLVAAATGADATAQNIAPVFVYVVFWVGMILISTLVGDLWRVVSPFATLAASIAVVRGAGRARRPYRGGYWPAAGLLFAFVWMELVYPDRAEPRQLAAAITVYTVVVLAGAARWGRDWLRQGEAFAAFFGVLAHMAPLYVGGDGRLRARPPLAGLATLERRPGLEALVLVALGSTTFDGVTRTRIWLDLTDQLSGNALTGVSTLGLVWSVALVALAYTAAMRATGRLLDRDAAELASAFVHTLVPIAFAYALAHYFSLFVFEGQTALALASDPLGRGWDLFGTATRAIDFTALSTTTIAYVQAGGIVAGHVGGVLLAHDRALALFPRGQATRSQYPLLMAMVLFTVGGLALLLGT